MSKNENIRIGLLLPQDGPIGMWNLSSENCAQLAIAELNSAGGILGREITYDVIDASGSPDHVALKTEKLIHSKNVEAIVGMHTSDVRVAVTGRIRSAVPYIYTPMYEGGETTPGVFLIGQTPIEQTSPMIFWMAENLGVKNWYLIGNDYNYGYVSNKLTRQCIREYGGHIVGERFVGFEQYDFSSHIKEIEQLKPDAVYVNLVGCSSVKFNRAFGAAGLHERVFRYCAALEENTLMSIGAPYSKRMYTSTGYYHGLSTKSAELFSKLYGAYFGNKSPVLNQFAVSCYEGLMLLSAMAERCGRVDVEAFENMDRSGMGLHGPRGELSLVDNHVKSETHIVAANGAHLERV